MKKGLGIPKNKIKFTSEYLQQKENGFKDFYGIKVSLHGRAMPYPLNGE